MLNILVTVMNHARILFNLIYIFIHLKHSLEPYLLSILVKLTFPAMYFSGVPLANSLSIGITNSRRIPQVTKTAAEDRAPNVMYIPFWKTIVYHQCEYY